MSRVQFDGGERLIEKFELDLMYMRSAAWAEEYKGTVERLVVWLQEQS